MTPEDVITAAMAVSIAITILGVSTGVWLLFELCMSVYDAATGKPIEANQEKP